MNSRAAETLMACLQRNKDAVCFGTGLILSQSDISKKNPNNFSLASLCFQTVKMVEKPLIALRSIVELFLEQVAHDLDNKKLGGGRAFC